MARSRISRTGEETRARIIEATLETIRVQGITGTTARAIAATGDFNQALIFYHFGSVNDAIRAAVAAFTAQGLAMYGDAIERTASLNDLVEIGRALFGEYRSRQYAAVLAQLFAAAVSDEQLARQLSDQLHDWEAALAEGLRNALHGSPLEGIIPYDDAARVIGALFLGLHQRDALEPDAHIAERLLNLAALAVPLLAGFMASLPAQTGRDETST